MRKLKVKPCQLCGKEYQPTGSCSKFCPICRREHYLQQSRYSQQKYMAKQGRQVGIGSGGLTGFGKDNFAYKHGLGTLSRLRSKIKSEQRYCGHCNKDLIESTHYQWVIHHIDHNKYNNPEDGSNWILLCKKCHQLEHQCWKAFEGATTSLIRLPNGQYSNPNKRSSQEGSEVPDTQTMVIAGGDIV